MSGDDNAAQLSPSVSTSTGASNSQESQDPTLSPTNVSHPTLNIADSQSPGLSNGYTTSLNGSNGHIDQEDKDIQPREAGTESGTTGNGTVDGPTEEGSEMVADVSAGSLESLGSNEEGQEWAPDGEHESKRVKVYELIGSRWVDQGTAFCFGQFQEETNEALLLARAEANYNNVILSTTIRSNDVYQRQQDTLIVWTEPDGVDYALSFQDPEGCSEVWNFILEVQRHMNAGDDHTVGASSPLLGPEPHLTTANIIRSGHLPQPQLGIISEIEKAIKALARTQTVKERICEYIQQEEYIKSLIEVMNHAEDLESLENLHALCSCMQTILMMNNHGMYEHILDDDIFFGVVGMLEYDPEFPTHKANYREFLHQTSHFHQPIPIRDETIQRKIHHTYRLQFLKDVVLARALDDSTFNVLNSCILFNQIDIITHVQHDPTFLREVVGLYVDEDMLSGGGVRKKEEKAQVENGMDVDQKSDAKPNGVNGESSRCSSYAFAPPDELSDEGTKLRREVVLLIQQLCVMGKNVQLPARMALFRALVDRGILFAVQWALSLPEKEESSRSMISSAGEILSALLDHDLNGVRGHVLKQVVAIEKERDAGKKGADKAETVLALMCRMMAQSRDLAVQNQVGDALKVLLEIQPDGGPAAGAAPSEANSTAGMSKLLARGKDNPGTEKFLDFFYKNCIETLFKPFSDIPEFKNITEPVLFPTREKTNLYVYLCDLLCNFALHHSFRSHFFILSSNIAPRVASLLRSRDKHLRLAAFRFFRISVKLNNRNVFNHLIKHDVFKPILALTLQESRRDNLLSSSCHEFFEHIRRENYKDVIQHCMTKHESMIRQLAELPLGGHRFISFIRRWEMNCQPPPPEELQANKNATETRHVPGHVAQRMEAEAIEDDYFTGDDWEEDESPEGLIGPMPFVPSALFAGPLSPLQKGFKRKRQNALGGAGRGRPGMHMLSTPPRTPTPPALGTLVDYEDEDDLGDGVPSVDVSSLASTSTAAGTANQNAVGPGNVPASPRISHRQIAPPRRAVPVDEDEDDSALEALVRGGNPPPVAEMPMKRRRGEDEDEDEMERLVSRGKRTDLGAQKEGAGLVVGKKVGDDPPGPKKIKLSFGGIALGGKAKSSPSEAGAKDGDTG